MNPWWFVLTGAGIAILAASIVAARRPVIGPREVRVFEAINGWPDWLYWPLWLPMQLGNLVVGTAAGLAVAWWQHDAHIAVGVVLAMLLKLVAEQVIRRRMAGALAVRQRPGTSQAHARLRGRVPAAGPSFPSGHVILVAAIGAVVAPHLAVAWWWSPALLIVAIMVGRVYVGAHNPLDVVAGAGAGFVLGGILAALAG